MVGGDNAKGIGANPSRVGVETCRGGEGAFASDDDENEEAIGYVHEGDDNANLFYFGLKCGAS